MGLLEILLIVLLVGLAVAFFVPAAAPYRRVDGSLIVLVVVVLVLVILLT